MKPSTLLLVILLIAKASMVTAQKANVSDSLALVDLYNQTNGKGWYRPWDLKSEVQYWDGVGLDINGRVVELFLGDSGFDNGDNLRGQIPASLGTLTHLVYLFLDDNQLTGTIPSSLGNLVNLIWLNLSFNELTGSIPTALGNLTNLEWLALNNNRLTGSLPASLGKLSKVANLELGSNQLSGLIPSSFGKLSNLRSLNLRGNQLSGEIPSELCNIPVNVNSDFTSMDLSYNKFTFAGMECIAQNYIYVTLGYQLPDLPIHQNGDTLSVNAGGTLRYNTYYWSKKRSYTSDYWETISVVKGDSTFVITTPGVYRCAIFDSLIYAADPNTGISTTMDTIKQNLVVQLIDPVPSMIDKNGELVTDETKIDTSALVQGAATDGLSKILVVANSSVPVTFSLQNKKDGVLSYLDGTHYYDTSITVGPTNGKVVAVYTPPDGYGESSPIDVATGGRSVPLYANDNQGGIDSVSIRLVTPPVVLVHGMWSDPNVWRTGGFLDYLNLHGIFKVYLADYAFAHAQTFDPKNPESRPARDAIYKQVIQAQLDAAREGIVATQVDVVGHSLGGLQTRSFSQDPRFLEPLLNYNKGFIHKLITIGTPHLGSEWGPILYYGDKYLAIITLADGNLSYVAISTLIGLMSKKKIGSCHRDFNPAFKLTGRGFDNLVETKSFKVHAIEARWDAPDISNEGPNGWSLFASMLNYIYRRGQTLINSPLNLILRDTSSDIIVPRYSQLGGLENYYDGLSKNFYDHFDYTTHSPLPLNIFIKGEQTETTNPDIQKRVRDLLLSDSPIPFASGFPAPNTIFTPFDFPFRSQGAVQPNSPKKESGINSNALHIISPTTTAILTNSGRDSVLLRLTFTDSAKLANSLFMVQDVGFIAMPSKAPYIAKIALPQSLHSGRLNLVALGNDLYGNLYADTISIEISATDTLKVIYPTPKPFLLDSLTRQVALHIDGLFTNGSDTVIRDITASSSGTFYSHNNASITTVSEEGMVIGKQGGKDTITVSNSGLLARVAVVVDSALTKVAKAGNSIEFTIGDKSVTDPPFALTATASSGQDVRYTLISGPIRLENGIVTIEGAGVVIIKAAAPGNAYFDSAVSVTRSFTVIESTTIYTFIGNGNWSKASNWRNGLLPPSPLPDGSEIIINPIPSGECILDVPQTISTGSKLTIKSGSKLIVLDNHLVNH